MKPLLFLILILSPFLLSGQDETSVLTIKTHLNDGIYTSVIEVVENNPKYDISEVIIEGNINGKTAFFFNDNYGNQQKIEDSTIVMVVVNRKKLVHFKKSYGEIIQLGAVTTFLMNTMIHSDQGRHMESDLHYWDLETGVMGKLSHKKAEPIIQRDSELYARYSALGSGEKKNTFYYYLLEYNKRNPVYMEE